MRWIARLVAFLLSTSLLTGVSWLFRIWLPPDAPRRWIDSLIDGILIVNARHQIVDMNQAACHILGLEKIQVKGKDLYQAAPDWSQALKVLLNWPSNEPYHSQHSHAGRFYELHTLQPQALRNTRLIVIRDITERKKAEETARQALELAEQRANRLEIIKNLAETLNQVLPPQKALEAGLELVANQVKAEAGWVLTYTPENKAVLLAGYNLPPTLDLARHRDHHWPLCACLREEQAGRLTQPIRVFNCERLARTKNLNEKLPKHHLSIPVRASGKPVGILNLIVPEAREFDESEIRLLALFGDQFGGAIERVHLFQEVRKMAITDGLTGLYNRRYFFEVAEQELERIRRYRHPLSVAMLDVDHFKQINDTYGHLAGDQVLRAVARISMEEIRRIDILGRYGGEEMVILMPETSHERASLAMERLRVAVEQAEIHTLRGAIRTTISIGMTSLVEDEIIDLQKLIDQADQALYQAKQTGRNRVCTFEKTIYNTP